MGKWKKKLRKFAKKAAPIAMLALGAAALAKRRKAKALNAITDYGDTGTLSGKAGFEGDVPSAPKKRYVNPNEETLAAGAQKKPKHWWNDAPWPRMAKGGRVGVGKARRGFGRALRKK